MKKFYKDLGHEGRLILGSFIFIGVCASAVIYSTIKDIRG